MKRKNKKNKLIYWLAPGLLVLFAGYIAWSLKPTPQPLDINIVSNSTYPITSTFVSPDLRNEDFPGMVKELKSVGIDTIIIDTSEVKSSDCRTFQDTYFLDDPNSVWSTFIRTALRENLKIFFGPRGQAVGNLCINPSKGTPNDPSTPMGHLIENFMTSTNKLKNFLAQEGVSWDDPRVAGLYIPEEIETGLLVDPNSPDLVYYTELSRRAKSFGKPLLISPYQKEETDYSQSLQAFKNLISKTDVTIIAPQDSLGTGFTKTAKASEEHYRALADAKKAITTKNVDVWANIELFQKSTQDMTWKTDNAKNPPKLIPAPFARVKSQIEAARPYVSKMTSWEYQHNMMVLPSANNLSAILTWNSMYTPALASRRAKLRSDYLATYSGSPATEVTPTPASSKPPSPACKQLYYYNKSSKLCVATSDTYNSSQINCTTGNTCAQNLNLYLKDTSTGVCYSTFDACKDANLSSNPKPSSTPTNNAIDLNRDSKVNAQDYQIFVSVFGKSGTPGFTPADLNHDGKVNIQDYKIFIKGYRQ